METITDLINNINEPRTLFLLCGLCIFTDVLTGYIKAFKNKKINSSISRDGYINKIGWLVALAFGYSIDYLVKADLFLIGSVIVCVLTEGGSIYENLEEIGIHTRLGKYFEKVEDENREGNQ